jgi:hypothetical protein
MAEARVESSVSALPEALRKLLTAQELEMFASLGPEERALFLRGVQELAEEGRSETLDCLWTADFVKEPLPITRFLEDRRFLGNTMLDADGGRILYDIWWDELATIFSPERDIWEVILTGAIGTGKTFVAVIIQLYKLYWLSCLRNPQNHFRMATGSVIAFGLYNVYKYKTETTSFHAMDQMVRQSPYFSKTFARDPNLKTTLKFPSGIRVVSGSQEVHALGENLFSVLIDEADFMKAGLTEAERGQAHDLHVATRRRMESRFMRAGRIPGITCLVSSKQTADDYVENYAEEHRDDPHVHLCDYSLWEAKPDRYAKKTFVVLVGDERNATRLLEEGETIPEGARVVRPPVDFLQSFKAAPEKALMDIAGISVIGVHKFIHDRSSLFECVDESREHPFSKEEITLDFRKPEVLEDFLQHRLLLKKAESRYRPKLNPQAPRFFAGDLALSGDCAGIALAHCAGVKQVDRVNEDGSAYRELAPLIYFDLLLRIRPPAGSQIDLAKIRQFVTLLAAYGYQIKKVTFDGFQSAAVIQELCKQGFIAEVYSVDRVHRITRQCEAYVHLRQAHFDRRVNIYRYRPYLDEMLHIEEDPKTRKVDHPAYCVSLNGERVPGSKDVSDAAASACRQIMTDETIVSMAQSREPITAKPIPATPVVDPTDHSWVIGDHGKGRRIVGVIS